MYGNSIYELVNAPRVGFQGVWGANGVLDLPIPSILPDIMVQLSSQVRTLEFTPMLGVNQKLVGVQTPHAAITPFGAGAYSIPFPREHRDPEVGLNVVPHHGTGVVFNSRLAWHLFPASLYTLAGAVYNVSTVPSTFLVSRRSRIPDWASGPNLPQAQVTVAKTNWFPSMSPEGLRLIAGVTAGNGAALMSQVMAGVSTSGFAVWLLRGAIARANTVVLAPNDEPSMFWSAESVENSSPSSEAAIPTGVDTPLSQED
jgi:hypothetical protein